MTKLEITRAIAHLDDDAEVMVVRHDPSAPHGVYLYGTREVSTTEFSALISFEEVR